MFNLFVIPLGKLFSLPFWGALPVVFYCTLILCTHNLLQAYSAWSLKQYVPHYQLILTMLLTLTKHFQNGRERLKQLMM